VVDARANLVRIPKRDYGPDNTLRRRVQQTILFQRGTVDISLGYANPMSSLQSSPVRHLLKDLRDDKTACGHPLQVGDTVEDMHVDGDSIECTQCMNEVSKG
jgi:hypothetical protein